MSISSIASIFSYVAIAYGLMSIGKAYGVKNPWLSWIPFASDYQLGAVADESMSRRYGRKTNMRIILLVLSIVMAVVTTVSVTMLIGSLMDLLSQLDVDFFDAALNPDLFAHNLESSLEAMSESEALRLLSSFLTSFLLPCLLLAAAGIVYAVFRFIALYRVYSLVDSTHASLYTVLSIFLTDVATGIIFLVIANKLPSTPIDQQPTGNDTPGTYSI